MWVAFSIVALALAGCGGSAPDAGPQGLGPPVFTVGDYWTYNVTVGPTAVLAPSNLTIAVASVHDMIEAGGKTHEAVRLETLQNQTNGRQSWTQENKMWQRKSDGAQLRAEVITTPEGGEATKTQTVYDVPCRQYPWPMYVGANMTGECQTHDPEIIPIDIAVTPFTVEVLELETVTVGAGTFLAYRLNVTLSLDGKTPILQTRWYAPEVCSDVRVTTVGAGIVATTELQAYACARGVPAEPA